MTAQSQASEISDAQLPEPGTIVGGKYCVDGFIARGGMGFVLAATHEVTGRRVALKWMLPQPGQDAESTHRVVREARAAARVRHPNVVDVYDVGEHDGAMFLVMELLEGETLHARLKASGALDPRTTLALLLPAMRGVEAAHQNGVIHRDLKPSNIFLCHEHGTSEPTPRVLDFGISKIMSTAGDGEHSLTRTGAVLGTPHYMPAERLTGGTADETTDVYALGVILYQCLTGRLPFEETNYNALVMQIGTATPPAVADLAPHVPDRLNDVVMRAMAREPEDRFANVGDLIEALLPFRMKVASVRAPQRTAGRWVIALAVVALAGIAAWASQQNDELEPAAEVAPQPNLSAPSLKAVSTANMPMMEARSAAPAEIQTEDLHAIPTAREEASSATEPARVRRTARPSERELPTLATEPVDTAKQPIPISPEQF